MVYLIIVAVIFLAELKIKDYIEKNKVMHKKEEILNGNIVIERYHNKGAMLNFLENDVKIVKTMSLTFFGVILLIFIFLLPRKGDKLLKIALSLILGGALSNIYDRFTRGYVVDYFSFKFLKKIVFNISDICIFLGSALTAIRSLFKR
ncbi:signal peptidase II [Anaerocolumna xylanovorans]|uniref:Lipoprotein signal peptidase n=1 Tax=Anaerocolumna xylanovorans DSM 12503 TaxID=1121345 RepID=A0A1M7Y861_9FIRM|nr:signal peptidase II [Anaerocolumna xylanovorans]SHO48809.1 signal peptidase II [Anaerocolumna xylanovorans DSM 12503]